MAKPSPSRTTGSRRARRSSSPPRRRSTPTPSPRTSRSTSSTRTTHLIVINKPVGHGGPSRARQPHAARWSTPCSTTAATASSGIGGVKRPGIVHRLDKDTSGVMVAAKTERGARAHLAAQFADHGRTGPLHRAYTAFAWGTTEQGRGTVDAPLGRDQNNRLKQAVRTRRPRGDHPLRASKRASAPRAGTSPAPLRARNRPHPPDPRAHGAYRPSAGRRPALCPRLCHQGQPAAGRARRRSFAASAGRRCTRRSLALSTRRPGRRWSSSRRCRPISQALEDALDAVRSRLRPLNTAARALKPAALRHVAASAPGLIIAGLRPISIPCPALVPSTGGAWTIRPRSRGKQGVASWPRSNLPVLSAEGGLSRYLQEIRKFPMLEPERGVHARQALQGARRIPARRRS